ncbi:MAG TPA: SAM-dependent methyltransferase, partial [Nitrosomonas sp.]|nr:SAM-dependent methyltransferase [Nitrosomonas sp.]
MHLIPSQLDKAVVAIRTLLPLEYPADAILRRFFQENPKLGAHDRTFIAETTFGILRHRLFLEHIVDSVTPRTLLLAYLVRF